MDSINLNTDNFYTKLSQSDNNSFSKSIKENADASSSYENNNSIHNSAVNVSISMESLKVFLNIKSIEFSQNNTTAQSFLSNIINNTNVYDFLSGKEIDGGFSLASIGYDGKPITDLSSGEANELISDSGFFGISKTSERVSSFVINLAGNDLESLQEARKGIVQGFEEAEKMWGGELPEISYQTQEKTLEIIDEKIEELLKTDFEKDFENKSLNTENLV